MIGRRDTHNNIPPFTATRSRFADAAARPMGRSECMTELYALSILCANNEHHHARIYMR